MLWCTLISFMWKTFNLRVCGLENNITIKLLCTHVLFTIPTVEFMRNIIKNKPLSIQNSETADDSDRLKYFIYSAFVIIDSSVDWITLYSLNCVIIMGSHGHHALWT